MLRESVFAVVDPLDTRVVLLGSDGSVQASSAPLPFWPARVRETSDALEFVDETESQSLFVPRTLAPADLAALAPGSAAPQAAAAVPRPGRRGRSISLALPGSVTLVAAPAARGRVTNARVIGRDGAGRYYVQTVELLRSAPDVDARSFVQRFSADGRLLDLANLPVEEMDTVPSRIVALSPSGDVKALVPTSSGLFFRTLSFRPANRARRNEPVPAGGPVSTPVQAVIQEASRGDLPEDDIRSAAPPPPTTRDAIMTRANAYMTVNWTMKPENFSRSGVENACVKQAGKHWLRPHRFQQDSIGRTFGPMPYHWGGGDTPEAFRSKIGAGALAGSVCTCRDPEYNLCVVSYAAGVDCSGFVSRSWGIPKLGTLALDRVARPVADLTQLRPGDALNKAGSHVRLFLGFKAGPEMIIDVLESAASARCGGMCRSSYTVLELARYRPLRFVGVRD